MYIICKLVRKMRKLDALSENEELGWITSIK